MAHNPTAKNDVVPYESWYQAPLSGVIFTDGFETGDLTHVDPSSGANWTASACGVYINY